jgi:cysteine desulfuration protein SufE
MTTLAQKQQELTAQLSPLKTGEARLAWLVERARLQPSPPADLRVDTFLVPGCLARLWFVPTLRDGLCYFESDSDSLITKAIAGLLCDIYSGQPPQEILAHDPGFLRSLGVTQHLTPNRRNALSRVWENIRNFAAESERRSPTRSVSNTEPPRAGSVAGDP